MADVNGDGHPDITTGWEEGGAVVGGALEPDPPIQRVATPLTHDQLLGAVTDTRGPGLHSRRGIGDLLVLDACVVVQVVVVDCHQPGHPGLGGEAGLEPGTFAHLSLSEENQTCVTQTEDI